MTDTSSSVVTWDLGDLANGPRWRGAVDGFSGRRITGWVVSAENPLKPVPLDILLFGERVHTAVGGSFRQDIAKYVKLPISAGYDIDLRNVSTAAAHAILRHLRDWEGRTTTVGEVLEVRVGGTDSRLPFSPGLAETIVDLDRLRAACAPLAAQMDGGQKELIRLRDSLLAAPLTQDAPIARVVAYYLPQFHPFAENDDWWGTGFTEWTNVTSAKPYFDDHYQPHLPADMGFYDLRLDQVQIDQIELAKKYGISGFCYYYYWFSGQTLMTLPIDRHLEKNLDIDFCLCWANESWSRRWDGSENDVLMAQRHTYESDVEFIRSCIKYFRSDRYIKIDGAPLLQVYRISLMEKPRETIERWREIVKEEGFPDLHVSMVESFGLTGPTDYGCDSSCQFPPHGLSGKPINDAIEGLDPQYSGLIYSYPEIAYNEIRRPPVSYVRFRTAMPSWDNTSRKGPAGNLFHGATPGLFEAWMRHLVTDAVERLPEGMRFVFVNAWNEWAEGTHLEPDRKYGHANLRAVRNALSRDALALAPLLPPADGSDDRMEETRRHVESLMNTNRALTRLIARHGTSLAETETLAFVTAPRELLDVKTVSEGLSGIDSVNGHQARRDMIFPVAPWQGLNLKGWFALPGHGTIPGLLALRDADGPDGRRYVAGLYSRHERPDVVGSLSLGDEAAFCGFSFGGTLRGVPAGKYEIELLCPQSSDAHKAFAVRTSIHLLIG